MTDDDMSMPQQIAFLEDTTAKMREDMIEATPRRRANLQVIVEAIEEELNRLKAERALH